MPFKLPYVPYTDESFLGSGRATNPASKGNCLTSWFAVERSKNQLGSIEWVERVEAWIREDVKTLERNGVLNLVAVRFFVVDKHSYRPN